MAANVETMFYTREKPWHGLGVSVQEAPTSKEALILAGLDWKVVQEPILTENGVVIQGYKVNRRDCDGKILGVVSNRYKVVQNDEAFEFTDALLGEGVTYETAGALAEGKRTWILAKLPHHYIISGDEVTPYMVFMNSHDGSGSIKVAMTPIRVVCQNTLNLALNTAKRCWSTNHIGNIQGKMDEARDTLKLASTYMVELGKGIEELQRKKLTDKQVMEYIETFFPVSAEMSDLQMKNMRSLQLDMKRRYFDAPDLKDVGKNGYRFINAVSDFATHSKPLRETANYKENLFARIVDGNVLIDRAYEMVKAA